MKYAPLALLVFASPSYAQTEQMLRACSSQQEIEQVLGSGGKFVPDGCRTLTINTVQSGDRTLCVLSFRTGEDPGVIARLQEAATPSQWWVSCDSLLKR